MLLSTLQDVALAAASGYLADCGAFHLQVYLNPVSRLHLSALYQQRSLASYAHSFFFGCERLAFVLHSRDCYSRGVHSQTADHLGRASRMGRGDFPAARPLQADNRPTPLSLWGRVALSPPPLIPACLALQGLTGRLPRTLM